MDTVNIFVSKRTANLKACKDIFNKLCQMDNVKAELIYIEDNIIRATQEGVLATPTFDIGSTRFVGIPEMKEILSLLTE